ncbi:hypothetical protein BKH41_04025 [Helicobacter sp. 12S02232-10]|uniref:dynamin family protein n=1 Tax=Helicobacter sp. 12S02232-10 TaxID=1476197 RepID=UPI000BA5AD7E|nr:dynamin family protein [Helicobacter sp. 12S02232-10]PAF49255.1 hypothetical protein BKH41_04025 [Helicobacter sp. 12S02232-10]
MGTKDDIAEYFFSLVYSQETPQDLNINLTSIDLSSAEEIFAIILSYNNRNKNIFLNTPLFQDLLQKFGVNANQNNIQSLQKSVLDFIQSKNSLKMIQEIFEHLNTLKTEGIILYEEEQCIKTSFKHKIHSLSGTLKKHNKAPKNKKIKPFDIQSSWFHQHLQTIQDIFKKTKNATNAPIWLEDIMKNQIDKILNTKFEISLCGIAKSGKSTLLNALLYEEILPISAIPESTNKITITYNPKPKGEIKFLTQNEWDRLLENLYFDDDLNASIVESRKSFGNYIDSCITQTGFVKEIKPEEIKTYASSEHYSKISYLVKEITIYSSMEFLKNNLVFVNTPNINTRFNYKTHQTENSLSQSVITLYLINASKPISQKDIEFLSNIIHYENLEKILIIFTRSDLVSLPDLKNLSQNIIEEVQKLQTYHPKILKKNISKIDFIPISSTLALLHRTGRSDEALSRGYDLEDTGIVALEDYINEIIFKQPTNYSKNLLLNTYAILEWTIKKYLQLLENTAEKMQISDLSKKLENAQKEILESAEKIVKAIEASAQNSKIKIKDLGLNLKEHLIDFISYEASKNNYVNASRLEDIIANNLKDSLKYLIEKTQEDFNKKMKHFIEGINQSYAFIPSDSLEFDLIKLYQKNILKTTKYQYTEGDLNLYTEELKKYINHILRDGAKLKDIQKNIDKAFDLSYKNIIVYLEEKIQIGITIFLNHINKMIESMQFVIINSCTPHQDLDEKEKSKQIEHFKALQDTILTQIKELKGGK